MSKKGKNSKLIVIDGNSLINRAYYAIQRPMMTKEGLYTQGVYGFLNILLKIREEYDPGYIVVAFDLKGPTFRHEEYKEYKAGRRKMPPELAMQIPLLKELLEHMKIARLEAEGFEADDLIGTVVKKAEAEGYEPTIITGDKDALQLASEKTRVLITRKGISEFDEYDAEVLQEKFGFSPEQFIDFKGLMGDPSDNIPGVPGVGEKTAQKLIAEYGSVENLIAGLESMPEGKLKDKISENIQLATLSRRLAEINTQVPIDIDIENFVEEEPDYPGLIEFYKKLEFNSFLKRLKITAQANEQISMTGLNENGDTKAKKEFVFIDSEDKLKELSLIFACRKTDGKKDLKASCIGMKTYGNKSHIDKPELWGVAFASKEKCYYVDCSTENLSEGLKSLFSEAKLKFGGHGLKDDYYTLRCLDFDLSGKETVFDTEIAQYLLQPGRRSYEFESLVKEHFHEDISSDIESIDEASQHAEKWASYLFEIWEIQESRLKEEELTRVFNEIELPLIKVLAEMEYHGIKVDRSELERQGKLLTAEISKVSKKIYNISGREFNISSPKQLGSILFEELKLPPGRKTKTGYSTDVEVLESLKGEHEIIDHILEYRSLTKLSGTYVEGLMPLINLDGRIHAHFQQTVAATGRISCTEPNLQNIPIKQERGRQIRKVFIPESEEWIFVAADYSQIELRVLAHLSDDPSLKDAFEKGADIHRATAARVFGIDEDKVTPLQRSNAKAVNFGVIYGMSGFGLASELSISRYQAEKYIEEYFRMHPAVRKYMDGQIEFCRENGFVTTIMGRRRPVPEIRASSFIQRQAGERLAMNSPIQGSAADIIKLAMNDCNRLLEEGRFKSRLILQVHDELIIETHKSELENVKKLLKETMENAVELRVPLVAEINTGSNWFEVK